MPAVVMEVTTEQGRTLEDAARPRRRKTDRYERPIDDHDLLTQLWTMFIHSCEEQAERHAQAVQTASDFRKELAEHRAAQNFRIDALAQEVKHELEGVQRRLTAIETADARQTGAWALGKWFVASMIAASGAGAAVATLVLRMTGH